MRGNPSREGWRARAGSARSSYAVDVAVVGGQYVTVSRFKSTKGVDATTSYPWARGHVTRSFRERNSIAVAKTEVGPSAIRTATFPKIGTTIHAASPTKREARPWSRTAFSHSVMRS